MTRAAGRAAHEEDEKAAVELVANPPRGVPLAPDIGEDVLEGKPGEAQAPEVKAGRVNDLAGESGREGAGGAAHVVWGTA